MPASPPTRAAHLAPGLLLPLLLLATPSTARALLHPRQAATAPAPAPGAEEGTWDRLNTEYCDGRCTGGVVGGVVAFVFLLAVLTWWWMRRRKQKRRAAEERDREAAAVAAQEDAAARPELKGAAAHVARGAPPGGAVFNVFTNQNPT